MTLRKQALLGPMILGAGLMTGPAAAETVSVACGTGVQLELCRESADRWEEKTGHTVNLVSTPNSSTEMLALFQQLLAAGASDIDVFQIDVIWPGILANHFLDLKPYTQDIIEQHFQPIVENNTVGDKLVALPWFTDAGVLYYRQDLLDKYGEEVPTTWDELERIAQKIQQGERAEGNDKMWGYVWQGRAYEGLTCNALEWVASHGGGTIVAQDGEITINNPQAVEAIKEAAGWVGNISPEGVLNYTEEEARGVFQSGNAAFMRNWPYAWSLGQSEESPIKGKFGVTVLPKGGDDHDPAACLGGWQLAVSRYSNNPDLAADLALHLASPEEQKFRAIEGSMLPTIRGLYEDQEVTGAVPFFAQMEEVIANTTPRPSTPTKEK
ncbi:MAG: ABC transporter substrate-binding protein, partial [Candidatus Competibacteraceae bacterium]|nr:ABC transporter substrate-binding protein [Candidatus Competibacteraceae bacterium]